MKETDMGSIPGLEGSSGEGNATHSSILAWKIPLTEEPDGLQSIGSQELDMTWRLYNNKIFWSLQNLFLYHACGSNLILYQMTNQLSKHYLEVIYLFFPLLLKRYVSFALNPLMIVCVCICIVLCHVISEMRKVWLCILSNLYYFIRTNFCEYTLDEQCFYRKQW